MTSTIKVNTVQNTCGADIIKESGNTITIGASGDTIALASGASQTGFGRTGTVDWQTTIKTTGFTAVSGEGYFCNTTGGAFTVTLPASPSAGDIVSVSDYANTFDTNALTLGRNGSNIGGKALDSLVATEGIALTLVYVDATKGWIVTDSGLQSEAPGPEFISATGGTITTVCTNYKVHTFTGPGTFTVCSVGNSAGSNTVSYMVVAGGGGAGGDVGGGGGAGGFRESKAASDSYTASPLNATSGPTYNLPVSAQGYPITVGSGGNGGPSGNGGPRGTKGSDSIFSTITSAGGGQGGAGPTPENGGTPGGSGGGNREIVSPDVAGSGNTPPVSPPQGQPGAVYSNPNGQRGGGGGATAAGVSGGPGAGGDGATTSINATPTAFAGGGGGGASPNPTSGGAGGGGGGKPGTGNPGTANTGGGGGGGDNDSAGGGGGSGIVIIRYKFQ